MPIFQPPPTYAEIILEDPQTKKPYFNPIWLKWFIDIQAFITVSGGPYASLYGSASQPFNVGTATAAANAVRLDQLVVSKKFNSGNKTITAAGTFTVAHGLGAEPFLICCWLKCLTAEYNYSIGDKVLIPGGTASSTADNKGHSIVVDSTNIVLRYGANVNTYDILNKTTGGGVGITNANWALVIEAFA